MTVDTEIARRDLSRTTSREKKAFLGQFLTPEPTARFMASLFPPAEGGACRLLDAGAGIGSLSLAFLRRCASGDLAFADIALTAYETDVGLHGQLDTFLGAFKARLHLQITVEGADFITEAVRRFLDSSETFTHAILNPPYKKIGSNSAYRLLARQVGLETVNLYSAFLGLTIALLDHGGHVVAIVPRSFCNGPYYRPFRLFMLQRVSIVRMHLFGSRNRAFKDDQVLQENVILHLRRGADQGPVTISTSTDDTFEDLTSITVPFDRVVDPGDREKFIHFPKSLARPVVGRTTNVQTSLSDLDLAASTGPVVDFRGLEFVRYELEEDSVPLLYPCHFSKAELRWPLCNSKKPCAILRNSATEAWLFPPGFYCVTRRFSSKEERRRLVASVVDPHKLGNPSRLGFENHLNVIHSRRQGLEREVAHGLAAYLNSTLVDELFRQFNGHTQVNATDLRQLKYPKLEVLRALGEWAMQSGAYTQEALDQALGRLIQ